MLDIEKHLGMSRDNLIAMALLLGCDYLPDGVPGVGRETVLKLLKENRGVNLLQRFTEWKSPNFDRSELKPVESSVYKKAMATPDFPSSAVRIIIVLFTSSTISNEAVNVVYLIPDSISASQFQGQVPKNFVLCLYLVCNHLKMANQICGQSYLLCC